MPAPFKFLVFARATRRFQNAFWCAALGVALSAPLHAQTASTPLELGQKAQLAGDWNAAIAQFESVLKTQPNSVAAMVGLGFSYFKRGELDEAEKFYRRALGLQSRHVGAAYGLGQISIERKKWDEAVRWFGDIVRLAPRFEPVRTRHNLALALIGAKRNAEATPVFEQALETERENLYLQLWRDAIDNAIEQRNFDTALNWSERATQQFPENAWLWDKLGWTLTQTRRRRFAGEAYERAAKIAYKETSPQHKTVLTLPFRGAWRVLQGNASRDTHGGLGARFAWDFVAIDGTASTFGQEIIAPAPGRIVDLKDGTPDNSPGHRDPSPHSGNYIVIEHATGEWSVLGHLQNGSIAVKIGDEVTRGQLLAKCGNSGYSTQPHLHFSFLGTYQNERISVPAQFSKYLQSAEKTPVETGVPTENAIIENQLPLIVDATETAK